MCIFCIIWCRCQNFYELPSTKTKRTTSFGFGSRGYLSSRQESPPPNTYSLPSDFDPRKKGCAFTFGISREAYAKVYAEAQPQQDKAIPGPGSYNVLKAPGFDANKFSFRGRIGELSMICSKITDIDHSFAPKTPGPGTYTNLSSISKNGRQFYSKFESSRAPQFNPPSSKRFQDLAQRLIAAPGPGQYNNTPALSETGRYFIAKYKSSLCRSFGRDVRDTMTTKGTHLSKCDKSKA